jgi:hypothetical protein
MMPFANAAFGFWTEAIAFFGTGVGFWHITLYNLSARTHGSDHALCEKVESTLCLCILKTGPRFSALCTA